MKIVTRPKVIVMFDPVHEYSEPFMRAAYSRLGVQSLALFTSRRDYLRVGGRFPALRGEWIAGRSFFDPNDLPEATARLSAEYDIRAVIPDREEWVTTANQMSQLLGLSWAQGITMERFRDKAALKAFLRSSGGPPMNRSCIVSNSLQTRELVSEWNVERFVLKPNSGFGNRMIAIMDCDVPDIEISNYFAETHPQVIIMEEFLEGDEYQVNGQVGDSGYVAVLMVIRCLRGAANGRTNVTISETQVPTSDPAFDQLATYVRQVVGASGLQRSPFHAEVIVERNGPRLIEIAGRMAGASEAFTMNLSHDRGLNVFELATRYYLSPESGEGPLDLDWEHYDSHLFRNVYGVSTESGRFREVRGVQEVEALPSFVRWIKPLRVHDRVDPTRDLPTTPYVVHLEASTIGELDAAESQVRSSLDFTIHGGWRAGARALPSRLSRLGSVPISLRTWPRP